MNATEKQTGFRVPLAVDELVANAASISKELFLKLQKQAEDMEMSIACGQDAAEGFDQSWQDLKKVLDACPWQMHPDYGCVRSEDVERLDRNAAAKVQADRQAAIDMPLDLSKPIYDTDGFEYSLVVASSQQIVTRRSGIFAIWDRRTRECRNPNCEGLFLTNHAMTEEQRRAQAIEVLRALRKPEVEAAEKPVKAWRYHDPKEGATLTTLARLPEDKRAIWPSERPLDHVPAELEGLQ